MTGCQSSIHIAAVHLGRVKGCVVQLKSMDKTKNEVFVSTGSKGEWYLYELELSVHVSSHWEYDGIVI